ncbi:phage baseplate assembly protein [Acetobacter oeni]|uniref:Tail protein n=1 Tax=Acetobacter oeni TaxID=304077 RepID=A0A511XP64_9PROT|nr:hypothetical protein [Acetobacter oeni]MBB3884495.1 prophage tail gpP-like protein [Acetobacter oeni]NHO20427.1 hypothetical protein [Acetobacter oeni]GBR00551.1 Mu-like bacteriophage tail protein GpP [Acetobacter oeni LMG 21952]GEN64694.1 tail protein [Acetobacter oeni]
MSETTQTVTAHRTSTGRDPNSLYLEIGGKVFSGWQEVRVTRGVERMPSDFDILLTEKYPGQASQIDVMPGQSCVVRLGDTRVITGYIDRYIPSISKGQHNVQISGRGKCQDIVDCSAIVTGMALGGYDGDNAETLIFGLVSKFGVTVQNYITDDTARANTTVPQFNVNLGETPWEIIDRISRWGQFLCYEDTFGNLVLSQVGSDSMESGFVEGINVEGASRTLAYDQRFSVYYAFIQATDQLSQQLQADIMSAVPVTDPDITRYRPKAIISEQTLNGQDIATMRLNWELARRVGRSQAVTLTCDTWRDNFGNLWEPNKLACVYLPSLKLDKALWVIGEVTYRRDDTGTHADLLLMPKEAYEPEPNVLQAQFVQIMAADSGSAAKTS